MQMNMNGRNGSSNNSSNNNGLPNLSGNLDLNLSLETLDQVGLSWVNREALNLAAAAGGGAGHDQDHGMMLRNTRRRVSSMYGNQQSHLLQANNVSNYSDSIPYLFHDPATMTRLHNQRLAQLSVVPSSYRSNSTPIWPQFQGQNPIAERSFMFATAATNPQQQYHQFNAPSAQVDQPIPPYQYSNDPYSYQNQPAPANVNLGLGGNVGHNNNNNNNIYNDSPNNFIHSQDPQQYYLDWLQTQNNNNQQMNYGPDSTGSLGLLFPPAQDALGQSRPSLSRRNRSGVDGVGPTRRNASNVLIEHRSTTTTRRRRGLARVILQLFNTQTELVSSMLHPNAGQAVASGLQENFSYLEDIVNMVPYEGLMTTADGVGVGVGNIRYAANGGLNEEEIMMSVERLMYCPSCFDSRHAGETCCICQEDYNHGEDICKLGCNHIYHFGCIKTWLMQKNFCPICKAPAMNMDGGAGPSNQTAVAAVVL